MAWLRTTLILPALLAAAPAPAAAFVSAPVVPTQGAAGSFLEVASRAGAETGRSMVELRSLTSFPATLTSRRRHGGGGSSSHGAARRSRTAIEGAARQVTSEELEREMTDWDLPLILDVFAVWCGPCVMLKPEVEKVAQALDGKCRVLKMDSDDESDMATTLNVYGLPTVLYMKDGEIKHRTEGSMPAEEILQLADIHLFDVAPPEDPADGLFIDTSACEPIDAASVCAPPADTSCSPTDASSSSREP